MCVCVCVCTGCIKKKFTVEKGLLMQRVQCF